MAKEEIQPVQESILADTDTVIQQLPEATQ